MSLFDLMRLADQSNIESSDELDRMVFDAWCKEKEPMAMVLNARDIGRAFSIWRFGLSLPSCQCADVAQSECVSCCILLRRTLYCPVWNDLRG